jgi:hypothetical protein
MKTSVEQGLKDLVENHITPRHGQISLFALSHLQPTAPEQFGLDTLRAELLAKALVNSLKEVLIGDERADDVENNVLGGSHDERCREEMLQRDAEQKR